MGSIIPIANQKGGVAKTTTAVNLAVALAFYHKKRVLLIDLDLSCNATAGLGYKAGSIGEVSFGSILTSFARHEPIPVGKAMLPTGIDNLSLIPGDREIASHFPTDYHFLLQDVLETVEGDYDFILIDTPPSRSPIIAHSYFAADYIVVPLPAEPWALEGLADIIEMIYSFSRQRSSIDPEAFYRIVLTKVDARESKSNQYVAREIEPFRNKVLTSLIRINADIKHAQESQQSIFHYNAGSPGAQDYLKLSEEIIAYDQSRTTKGQLAKAV